MKKIVLLLVFVLFSTFGCAHFETYFERTKKILTIEKINNTCEPTIAFPFTVFNTEMFVLRAEQCAGFDDLFALGYHTETNEFSETLTKLMVLEFLRGHNADPENKDNQLGYIFLKEEIHEHGGFVFYEFKVVELD